MTNENYNLWCDFYDQDNNPTRDLDHLVIRKLIQQFKNKKIIEIGCGTGKNTVLLSEVAAQVLAIDFSEGMIEKARIKMRDKKNVEFEFADITEKWPCKDNYYDVVMCSLVLEHIENIYLIFSEASRVLIEAGEFFINEFHPFRQYQGKKAYFQKNGKKIELEYFVHDVSEFINSGLKNNFELRRMEEYRDNNKDTIPRLVSFTFIKKK
jgi:malonyl-CoA O-methyltransferase